jgi:preprotein translocase subunit SecE
MSTSTWRTSLVVLAVIAALIVLAFVAQKALS